MRDLSSVGQPLPLDRQVDRRSFLSRLGALTAAASAGGLEAAWRARPVAAAPSAVVRLPRVSV